MNATLAQVLYRAVAHHLGAAPPLDLTANADRVAAGELIGAELLTADLTPATCIGGLITRCGSRSG